MQNLSAEEITEVEAVICSNDSMALGVADFYAKQKLPPPVIIGINGIQDMQDAIDAGMIYGTVDLNVPEQAKTIFAIIQGNFDTGAEMPKEKVCYLPQSPYTK